MSASTPSHTLSRLHARSLGLTGYFPPDLTSKFSCPKDSPAFNLFPAQEHRLFPARTAALTDALLCPALTSLWPADLSLWSALFLTDVFCSAQKHRLFPARTEPLSSLTSAQPISFPYPNMPCSLRSMAPVHLVLWPAFLLAHRDCSRAGARAISRQNRCPRARRRRFLRALRARPQAVQNCAKGIDY